MSRWFDLILGSYSNGLIAFLMRRPRLLRTIAGWARRIAPVLRFGSVTLVTSAEQVREVLERDRDFLLGPINERKVMTGDFMLSLDRCPRYQLEKERVRRAFQPGRIDEVRAIAEGAAGGFLDRLGSRNTLDAVELSEHVTVQIAERFWGLPAEGAHSEVLRAEDGEETMGLWLRKLAAAIGSTEPAPFGLYEVARTCRDEFLGFLRDLVERQMREPAQHVLGRIAASGLDRDAVVRNIAGLVVTASAVVTKAFAHAFEQLLLHDEARGRAIEAVRRGRRDDLDRLMVEALRFNPVFPVLVRRAPRATTLAAGTPHEREIPAGSTVYASPLAAMFDESAVREPDRFGYGRRFALNRGWAARPDAYGQGNGAAGPYLLFGTGMHWCIGDEIAIAEMTAMATALLARGDPRLVRRLRYDGPAVASLIVGFDRRGGR